MSSRATPVPMHSPLPFALVLLSIEWARCLGEMIMVRRASSWQVCQALLLQPYSFNHAPR